MTYAYVLLSDQDERFYVSSAGDLRARLQKHNSGAVRSTEYQPLRRRERYLKSGRGGRYLKQRLASWLAEIRSNKLERH
jgi:hypothetical protein